MYVIHAKKCLYSIQYAQVKYVIERTRVVSINNNKWAQQTWIFKYLRPLENEKKPSSEFLPYLHLRMGLWKVKNYSSRVEYKLKAFAKILFGFGTFLEDAYLKHSFVDYIQAKRVDAN